jgi:GTP-binding protein SAR1
VPLLLLGNKIDKKNALSEGELRTGLDLQQTTGKVGRLLMFWGRPVRAVVSHLQLRVCYWQGKLILAEDVRPIELFMCSFANRCGYGDGLRWLSQYLLSEDLMKICGG